MKKTEVIIHNNREELLIYFALDKDTFMKHWYNMLPNLGYFHHSDEMGNEIIINPSQCGVIEISEVNA